MTGIVEVKLWGTTIGRLGYSPGQTAAATFEWDDDFVRSGIQPSPVKMKYPPRLFTFPDISERTFKGLPGFIADSLPDTYGDRLIDLYMAEKNIAPADITALDRLLYVGTRGMGALEYHPSEGFTEDSGSITLDITMLSELAEMVVSKKNYDYRRLLDAGNRAMALKLSRVGSSAGGARSKALVARSSDGRIFDGSSTLDNNMSSWILKFDSSSNSDRDGADPKGMPRVEYIYSLIASECGIDIPKTDYISDGDDFHFLIERFDRVPGRHRKVKVHYASWAGLAHADRDASGYYSYEQLILFARELGLGQDAITELFRRTVFNIIGRNQDDHTKNFGFLMNKHGEWSLAPAFDLTYAYDPAGRWTRVHQLRLGRKQDGFERADLINFGRYCNLGIKKAEQIITEVKAAFDGFKGRAHEWALNPALSETVWQNLRREI